MIRLSCECGIEMNINGLREEMVDYVCPRCFFPIGRQVTEEDRQALEVRKFWHREMINGGEEK